METPIVDADFVLKKGPEKGAWTFIEMPVMPDLPKKKNSTVRVRGTIDNFELTDFHIWAMKKGTFMAVRADIRKAIKKEEGQSVRLVLFLDDEPAVIPDDFLLCLKDEPKLLARFQSFSKAGQLEITNWIFSATTEDGKVQRIAQILEKLESPAVFKL